MDPTFEAAKAVWTWIQSNVSTFMAFVALVGTQYYYIRTVRKNWISNSAKMVSEQIDYFRSDKMREYRCVFANSLTAKRNIATLRGDQPVMAFFEDLGYMMRRRVLDTGMVWNAFFWLIEIYYSEFKCTDNGAPDLIADARNQKGGDKAFFREFEYLFNRLKRVDAWQKRSKWYHWPKYKMPSAADREKILNDEVSLVGMEEFFIVKLRQAEERAKKRYNELQSLPFDKNLQRSDSGHNKTTNPHLKQQNTVDDGNNT